MKIILSLLVLAGVVLVSISCRKDIRGEHSIIIGETEGMIMKSYDDSKLLFDATLDVDNDGKDDYTLYDYFEHRPYALEYGMLIGSLQNKYFFGFNKSTMPTYYYHSEGTVYDSSFGYVHFNSHL